MAEHLAWPWGSPRGTLALAIIIVGTIANVVWIGYGTWMILAQLGHIANSFR